MVLRAPICGKGGDCIRWEGTFKEALEVVVVTAREGDSIGFGALEVSEDMFSMG